MKSIHFFAATGFALTLGATASAAVIVYNFQLDGLQEVPPNASPGFGNASVTLDTTANTLNWNISWGGLIGSTTAMHFHGDAPAGVNAGVIVNIGAISGIVSPSIGGTGITDLQEASIMAGLWYVNIHSTVFPGGEIRGQVVPAPSAAAVLGLAGLGAMRRRRRA